MVKPDAHDASIKHYYPIVHDSEIDKDVDDSRFGIEVDADIFQRVQAQNGKDESPVPVGSKSAGTATTAFVLPVLDGRISAW